MPNHYENVMQRFGLNPNLPMPQFEKPITKLSDAERAFLLSEKKWHLDHDPLPKETEEIVKEGEEENGTK